MTDSSFELHKVMARPLPARMPPATAIRWRGGALALALAGGIEFGLQLVVPIILVRRLDPVVFAQYRLLWLMAGTVLAIAPAFMPQGLFYFLPRASPGHRRMVIGNVLAYLTFAAAIVGVVTFGWNPILPVVAQNLFFQTASMSTIFLSLWVVASLLDVLPTAEDQAPWQSRAIIALAILRTLLLAGASIIANNIFVMVSAMLVVAVAKLIALAYYVLRRQEGMSWQMVGIRRQLAYCLPFAVGNALFLLRLQADQWVVVSMLDSVQYAIFSIAAVLLPIASLIRQPVNNALMPPLNSAHARGDFNEIQRLIVKANVASALFLLPISGFLFSVLPELVCIVYTARYSSAVPIMQVYLIGMMVAAFAVGHVLPVIERGQFAAVNSACCLALSVLLSIVGVLQFGVIGAALGSVVALVVSEVWSVHIVSRALGVSVLQLHGWRALWPVIFATTTSVVGVTMLVSSASGGAFPMLLLKGLAYAALFALCFVFTGGRQSISLLTGRLSMGMVEPSGNLDEKIL